MLHECLTAGEAPNSDTEQYVLRFGNAPQY